MVRTVDSQSTNQSSTLCASTKGLGKNSGICEIPDVRSRRIHIPSVGRVIDPNYTSLTQSGQSNCLLSSESSVQIRDGVPFASIIQW